MAITFNDHVYFVRSIARRLSRSTTVLYWTLPLNLRHLYAWRMHGAAVDSNRRTSR